MKHYHLIAEFAGCIPEYNEVYPTKEEAEEAFHLFVEDLTSEDEVEYKDATFLLLKNNLRVYIGECEGCELWNEAQNEAQEE